MSALSALAASWLFFAGLAAGGVALAAAIRIAHGGWARAVLPIADACTAFFAPAFGLLLVLVVGARLLAPDTVSTAGAARLVFAAAAVFLAGAGFVRRARDPGATPERVRAAGLGYVLVYVVGLSVWAFDLVLARIEGPLFTVVPPYYFLGAFLSGLAFVAFVAAVRDVSGPDLRHDLGKLLFAFIVVWSYLLWALYLPTWYGNIPEEAAILLRRWSGGYRPLTIVVPVAVFAWPFWLLFSEKLKRRRSTLAAGAGAVLVGLWIERFLLVLPSGQAPGAGAIVGDLAVAAAVAAVFLAALRPRLRDALSPRP